MNGALRYRLFELIGRVFRNAIAGDRCYVLAWLTRIGVQSLKLLVQRNLSHCDYLLNPARAANESVFTGGVVDLVFVLRVEGRRGAARKQLAAGGSNATGKKRMDRSVLFCPSFSLPPKEHHQTRRP